MKKVSLYVLPLIFLGTTLLFIDFGETPDKRKDKLALKHEPHDHFYHQRAYPDDHFDLKAFSRALKEAQSNAPLKSFPGFDNPWSTRGPGNIGARINTIAVHPADPLTIYVGFSGGGVFKTTNGGSDWVPVFDDQTFLAIGDIAIDPQNPETVYVGTGDPNISGYPSIGDGIYKSENGGTTWTHLGLTPQRIISKIIIDPVDTDRIYVGCMGIPFERNNDRGLYRTTDGGETWDQVLFVADQAGIIDMVMDHQDPNIIYAASWDRIRNNMESTVNGPNAKIFKTTDGGDNWTALGGGLPDFPIGRVGLTMSANDPLLLYAVYVGTDNHTYNIFKTIDGGENWIPIIDFEAENSLSPFALGGFGWYFGKIRVNPYDDNDIFLLGVELWRSQNGGVNWSVANPPWWQYVVHADKHDLVFLEEGNMLLATDGGLYQTADDATNWVDIENIPATQFYRVAYNPHVPSWYYGGAQDNGTTGGFNATLPWQRIYGGDGFQPIFHPDDPNIFYVETQNGSINVTVDGGNDFDSANDGIDGADRRNWDMPIIMSSHDPSVMYTGTFRVYKSETSPYPFWQPISEDLTDGIVLQPRFHNISTLFESPVSSDLLYVGTNDGNVWRTDDGGENWIPLAADLPNRYVTDIKASADMIDNVYVSHSGYKDNEFNPRIFRSTNRGEEWEDISGDLPDLAINDIYILPGHQDTVLFVATDGGVYGTMNSGESWGRLGSNMPMVPVYDLDWNVQFNELIAGTHARSIMTFPLDSLVIAEEPVDTIDTGTNRPLILAKKINIFPSPAKDQITLEFSNNEPGRSYDLIIIDPSGKVVYQERGNGQGKVRKEINLNGLPAGQYYAKIRIRHQVLSQRFIKI